MKSVRGKLYFLSMLLMAASITSVYQAPEVQAAQITTRSLQLLANGNTGGSAPGGIVNHQFTFTVPTTGTALGSIKFEYCTIATQEACVPPTGMDASTATFGGEATSGATGFSMGTASEAPTANSVIIKRASASTPTSGNLTYTINNVKNPTPENYTFFVRITTHTSLNASDSAIDTGTVAASTANPIVLTGIMPESLIFCTGGTIPLGGNGQPDCTNATSGAIEFNQLFSPQDTATATSQMAASTNALNGYVITVNGPLLTSASANIPAMTAPSTITRGKSEFGMNLVANTTATSTVAAGSDITPASNTLDLRGQVTADYATADQFKFVSGDTVANSANGGAGPTNAQRYTATYIVNVAGNQLAGTYNTTLTYICTPTF